VVAHRHAEEGLAGLLHLGVLGRPRVDLGVGVEEVGVGRVGPEIDPLADPAIAQMPGVGFVGVALEDGPADLAGDFADRTDRGIGFDVGLFEDGRARTDVGGAGDDAARTNRGVLVDDDGAEFGVEDDARHDDRIGMDGDAVLAEDHDGGGRFFDLTHVIGDGLEVVVQAAVAECFPVP